MPLKISLAFSIQLICHRTVSFGKINPSNLRDFLKVGISGRLKYSQEVQDDDEYFEGTERLLPENNWHKTGYDPKLISHGQHFKVEPGSTVRMSCRFANLSGEEQKKSLKVYEAKKMLGCVVSKAITKLCSEKSRAVK